MKRLVFYNHQDLRNPPRRPPNLGELDLLPPRLGGIGVPWRGWGERGGLHDGICVSPRSNSAIALAVVNLDGSIPTKLQLSSFKLYKVNRNLQANLKSL